MEICKKHEILSQLSAISVKFTFNFIHYIEKMSCMGLVFPKL